MATAPTPALAELLAHTRWVEELARSLVRDPNAAEDLAQTTLLIALERHDAPRDLRAWLATVLRNLVRERGRREANRPTVERVGARTESLPAPDEIVERAECERNVVAAVLELDEPHRGTILLRYFEGLSPEVIARRSHVPLATVTSRITRAHARLRERLSKDHSGSGWVAAIAPIVVRVKPSAAGAAASSSTGALTMAVTVKFAVASALLALIGWWLWPTATVATQVASIEPTTHAGPALVMESAARADSSATPLQQRETVAVAPTQLAAAKAPAAAAPPVVATAIGGRIFGRIIRPDGQAASKRKVRMLLMNKGPEKFVTTDDTGAFDERNLDPGVWSLSTWPDAAELELLGKAHADTLQGMVYMTQRTVDLERGMEVEVVLGKRPADGVHVHGRMLLDGLPIEGYMTWLPDGHDAMDRQRLATASEKSGFEVLLDGPGRYLLVAIHDEVRSEFIVEIPRATELEHDIVFPTAILRGRVATTDGQPVIGASLDLTPRAGHNPRHPSANITFSQKTDDEGKFSFRCLPHARYALAAHGGSIGKDKERTTAGALALNDVDLRSAATPDDLVLVTSTGSRLRGIVHSASARVSSTYVFVFAGDGEPLNPLAGINADKEGKFELFALVPGRYFAIGANGDSWSDIVRFDLPAKNDAGPLSLELKPAAKIIVDIRGREPAWIDVRDANNCCLSAVFDMHVFNRAVNRDWSSSSFDYRVPPGNYDVRVVGVADTVKGRVSAFAGQSASVDLSGR